MEWDQNFIFFKLFFWASVFSDPYANLFGLYGVGQ